MLVGVLGAGCGTDARPVALAPQADKAPSARLVVKPAPGKPLVTGAVNTTAHDMYGTHKGVSHG